MSLHDTACEQRVPDLDHCHRKVSLWIVVCWFFLLVFFLFGWFLLGFLFFQLLMLTWNFLFPELPLACQMFPSMHSFLHRPAFLVRVSPELDPAFQMRSSSAEQKRNIISPGLLAARGAASLLGQKLTRLAHICLPAHQDLFCRATLQLGVSQHALVPGVVPIQRRGFTFPFIDLHEVLVTQSCLPVKVLLSTAQ